MNRKPCIIVTLCSVCFSDDGGQGCQLWVGYVYSFWIKWHNIFHGLGEAGLIFCRNTCLRNIYDMNWCNWCSPAPAVVPFSMLSRNIFITRLLSRCFIQIYSLDYLPLLMILLSSIRRLWFVLFQQCLFFSRYPWNECQYWKHQWKNAK